jgi:hypothetical protein
MTVEKCHGRILGDTKATPTLVTLTGPPLWPAIVGYVQFFGRRVYLSGEAAGVTAPNMPARRIVRDVNEAARDVARALAKTEAFARSRRDRKKVEKLFAHLKRILRRGRLRLRGPS